MALSHSESITGLMGAMLQVQGAVDGVRKDSKNPHFRSSYASLEAVVDTIRPACQAAGLVVMQAPGEYADGVVHVETMIVHAKTGEWIKGAVGVPVAKQDPQGLGSALTYAERYSLMAMFVVPPVDDDGEAARNASSPPREQPSPPGLADNLMLTLNRAQSADEFDEIKNDPDFKALWAELSPSDKARVAGHGRMVMAKFAAPVMAG